MRIQIELTAVFEERRVLLGSLPLNVDLGLGVVTLSEGSIPLSRREAQVLDLMITGKVHKEIAAALNIGERTVKFHASAIYAKYGVNSRAELIAKVKK